MPLRRSLLAVALGLPAALALSPITAFAQGIITGSIAGTVQDASGAAVSGADIVAHNNGTGTDFKAHTGASGEYTIVDLPIGEYTVTITGPGFSPSTLTGVSVRSGVSSSAGMTRLSVTATESVDVGTTAAILQTEQSQVTTTFDTQQITDLPTGGGLDRLTLLIPGVVRTLGNNYANTNGTGISSNGLRGRSNNFEIDGQSNNDNSISGPQLFFHNEDALSEIQIVTNNFGAQYGRNAGSIINYNTKQGTNRLHGTAFENYVGSWGSSLLQGQKSPNAYFGYCAPGQTPAANGCVAVQKPRIVANEYGGTLGGPILHDKLFFFGGTLWRRVINGANPSISSYATPTPAGLQQLQAAYPGNPFVTSLVNNGPYSVPYGGPAVVTSTIATRTVCAAAVTTCTAGTAVQFAKVQRSLLSTALDQEHVGRLDYQPTAKDRVFLRYIYQDDPTLVSGGTISTGAYYNTFGTTHSIGSDWTHTFSSRWLNQLRYSFQQSKLTFGDGGYPNCTTSNLSSCPSSISLSNTASGYGQASNIPQGRIVKVTQVQDNANWSFGRHAITFGGEFDYQNSPNTFLPNTSGTFTFNNFNYALAGNGTLSLANGTPQIPFKEPDVAAYFQDDWKVSPALTFNLGLRWEFFKQGINVLHDLSVARQTGPNPIWNTALPLSQTTFPYLPNRYKNFQPRIGFAYNPSADSKLVIRGGFAIDFDPAFYNIFLNSYTSAPVVNTGVITCNGTTTNCLPAGGTTNALIHAQDDQYNPTGVNPGVKTQTTVGSNFSNPYVENYTLGLQHSIGRFAVGEVRYVGNHGVKLFQSVNANPSIGIAPPASVIAPFSAANPGGYKTLAQAFPAQFPSTSYCTTPGSVGLGFVDCNRTYVTSRGNTSFSIYNALQMSLDMRSFYGFSGKVSYTYSRTIDNANEVYSSSPLISIAQSPFNTNIGERGVSAQSYPNVTSAGITYTPNVFKGQHGILGHALGGWQANTLYTFNSGQPYAPYQPTKFASSGSPAITKIPTANQGQALYSFCDYYYNSGVLGQDTCRPILANNAAPLGTVGINGGPGVGYLNIATGAAINRSDVHWLVNNQYEAQALGTPYPGVPRNTLRGNTVNELDLSIFKTVDVKEGMSFQFRINVYNLPNRAFYSLPDGNIQDANPSNNGVASFSNFQSNSGTIVGTAFGRGARNIQLGGKFIF